MKNVCFAALFCSCGLLCACQGQPTLNDASGTATLGSASNSNSVAEPSLDGSDTTANGNAVAAPVAPSEPTGEPSSADVGNTLMGSAILGPGANMELQALRAPIQAAAMASGVSANVLAALVWAESRAQVDVAGGGLTQMGEPEFQRMKAAHPQIVGSLSDAGANVMSAAFYLLEMRELMQQQYKRNELGIVLRAYNSGSNGVDPNNLSRLPAGTGDAQYVTRVTQFAQIVATGKGSLPL